MLWLVKIIKIPIKIMIISKYIIFIFTSCLILLFLALKTLLNGEELPLV